MKCERTECPGVSCMPPSSPVGHHNPVWSPMSQLMLNTLFFFTGWVSDVWEDWVSSGQLRIPYHPGGSVLSSVSGGVHSGRPGVQRRGDFLTSRRWLLHLHLRGDCAVLIFLWRILFDNVFNLICFGGGRGNKFSSSKSYKTGTYIEAKKHSAACCDGFVALSIFVFVDFLFDEGLSGKWSGCPVNVFHLSMSHLPSHHANYTSLWVILPPC